MIVACAQLEAKSMNRAATVWPAVERMADLAETASADLVVFPEVVYPSYWLESVERYRRSDIEPSEKVLRRFSEIASRHSIWIVAGFVEEVNDALYNSAAVFDRAGNLVASARKQFMWDCDQRWFQPGWSSTVIETEFGKMGLQICADMRLPEISATLVAGGAQFMIQPTAWVNADKSRGSFHNVQAEFLIRARAIEFGLPFVSCSKSGREDSNTEYVGQSCIVSAEGEVLASASPIGDQLVTAEIRPRNAHVPKIDERVLARLQSDEPPFVAEPIEFNCHVHMRQPAREIGAALETAGVRFATISADDLSRFAVSRYHALDGVQALLVEGHVADDCLARARAAENCIFVVVASQQGQLVVDPGGEIAWRRVDAADEVELDLARADAKQITPMTGIWSERRASTYRLRKASESA